MKYPNYLNPLVPLLYRFSIIYLNNLLLILIASFIRLSRVSKINLVLISLSLILSFNP